MTVTEEFEPTPVTAEQLVEITQAVWQSFVGMDLEPVPTDTLRFGEDGKSHIDGVVQIAGTQQAMVLVQGTAQLALDATCAMFAMEPDEVTDGELADAFGEVTNMIGGNIKGLYEGLNQLSLPTVTRGRDHEVLSPGTSLVDVADFDCRGERLRVSVWRPGP
jgi:chemotaxis protein CheX